ncbi:Fic family protein [Xanthobacter sp. V13C-7B]|uniref:Fic family protein n=1 Tax=Xanthobacter variabilis TaxID=3119932 RepID=UPI0037285AD6
MTPSLRDDPSAQPEREQLEGVHTRRRITELRLDPVRGEFDAAHLQEINRRIFQDLPGLGFTDVTPGQYRSPVQGAGDWIKVRGFETIPQAAHVAYSRMDDEAKARLDKTLAAINPLELAKLEAPEFTKALAKIYTDLDYIHPFSDGNSRTLREFTRQIADAAGYGVEWERFARAPVGRDLLYIARDLSVNEQALPDVRNHDTRRDVQQALDMFEGNRALPDLLGDAVWRKPPLLTEEQLAAPLLPAQKLAELPAEIVNAKALETPRVQSARLAAEAWSESVYGDRGAITTTLLNIAAAGTPADAARLSAKAIEADPEAAAPLRGRPAGMVRGADDERHAASSKVVDLALALEAYGDAIAYERGEVVRAHRAEQVRAATEIPAPSRALATLLAAPEQTQAVSLKKSPEVARELASFMDASRVRLTADDRREIVAGGQGAALAQRLNVDEGQAAALSKVYRQGAALHTEQRQQVRTRDLGPAITR